jgi:dihydrofolate reductase
MIVACDLNQAIGLDNQLPWKLSSDLARFKQLTMGHHLLMGRKTFESIGKALPGRVMLVLSRSRPDIIPRDVYYFNLLDMALGHARRAQESELFIIGGGEIYRECLSIVDKLYLTEVQTKLDKADTYFPEYANQFSLVSEEYNQAQLNDEFDWKFKVMERKQS